MESPKENKPKVLYVDDIQANLMLFEASFDAYFNITLADSARKALALLENEEFHVLVSDQNMPGMTGNELLEIVTVKHPDVMRFMITAYTDYDTVVDAINKGNLYGYFNKPYKIEEVRDSIVKSLEVRDLRLKNREMIQKLEHANDMLVGLNRSKIKFLGSVTEEIRSPINKIMTAVHMLKDKVDSNELSELLYLLDVSVRRLENFSDSAKQLIRLNEAGFKPDLKPVSLRELAEVCIIEKGNLLSNENIDVELNDSVSGSEVDGEYELLLLTLTSLIDFMTGHLTGLTSISMSMMNGDTSLSIELRSDGDFSKEWEKELMKVNGNEQDAIADQLSLEIVLAKEIMRIHRGELKYTEDQSGHHFIMQFSVE